MLDVHALNAARGACIAMTVSVAPTAVGWSHMTAVVSQGLTKGLLMARFFIPTTIRTYRRFCLRLNPLGKRRWHPLDALYTPGVFTATKTPR